MASPGNLASGTALTGSNASQWANAILGAIGAPASGDNVASLTDWFAMEGGGGSNNPLNTTLSAAGATGSINSSGVKNYATPAQGIAATAQTLQGYPAIVAALKTGSGLVGIDSSSVAAELSQWSGGGYSTIGGTASASTAASTGPAGAAGTTTTGTGTGGSATYTFPALDASGVTLTAYNPLNPFETIDNIMKDLTGIAGTASDIPGAINTFTQVIRDLGAALMWAEHAVEWLFVPSHWVRIACGAGGTITGVPGMYALMKAGQGSGDVTLALGILLTTVSAVLWFIAFHNIPNYVNDLQQLLAWMTDGIKSGKGTYAGDSPVGPGTQVA